MRISDWSSDVCSSDLDYLRRARLGHKMQRVISERPTLTEDAWRKASYDVETDALLAIIRTDHGRGRGARGSIPEGDRKSVVWGKSVSVRVDLGGRGSINKKQIRTR